MYNDYFWIRMLTNGLTQMTLSGKLVETTIGHQVSMWKDLQGLKIRRWERTAEADQKMEDHSQKEHHSRPTEDLHTNGKETKNQMTKNRQ